MEDEHPQYKTYSFSLTIQDKVFLTVLIGIISVVSSFTFTLFYKPPWVESIITANNKVLQKINNEKLVLIGSGTVFEYLSANQILKEYYEIIDSSCLITAKIPSMAALKTLKDEKDNISNWIVLSAVRAKNTDFMDASEFKDYKKSKRIVEVFLKKRDKLAIIINQKSKFDFMPESKEQISVDELKEIVLEADDKNFTIYTTSDGSGTLKSYTDILGNSHFKNTKVFNLESTFEEKPYLILASDLYKPKNHSYSVENTYHVYKGKNEYFEKELYMYFNAKLDKSGKILVISETTQRFLNCAVGNFEISGISEGLVVEDISSNTNAD